MNKTSKLNLDDIDFDAAFGATDDGAKADDVTPQSEQKEEEQSVEQQEENQEGSEGKVEENTEATDDDSTTGEETEEVALLEELRTKLGFEIEGDFEDSPEGLLEFTKAASQKIADTQLRELFEAMPDVEQYLKYRLQGGDSAQFFQTFYGDVDYSTLQVSDDDVVTQEHLVRQAMALKGFEPEDINDSVKEFKNSGLLHSQATKALKGLTKYQAAERERLIQEQERAAAQAAEQTAAYWNGVKTTLQKSNEFRGIPVSEKEKAELLDYISRPVTKDGMSAFQVALDQAPVDVFLALAALMKKDFNLDGLVTRKAATQQAQNLRDRLSKDSKKLPSRPSKGDRVVDKPDFSSLALEL